MAALASVENVQDMFRVLTSEEIGVVPAWLDYISAQARIEAPWVDARVSTDPDYADLVKGVLTSAVIRVLRNPDGWRQWSVDDAGFTRDQVISAGMLYLTDIEIRQLQGQPSTNTGGFYVVSLSG